MVVVRDRSVVEEKIVVAKPSDIVQERFALSPTFRDELRTRPMSWGFGQFSQAVYYRTYSRTKPTGGQEAWADTVIRVVEGVMSIRKDWYKNVIGKRWNDEKYYPIAEKMAEYIFDMKFLPPGRGLWAMGTDYVYERGCAAVNNCGAVVVDDDLADSAAWLTDNLMCVTDDTWVSTVEGPRQVRNLINRPCVVYVQGQPYYSKTGFFFTGERDIVRLDADGFSVRLTADHKVNTPKGWVEAGKLQPGDEVTLGDPGLQQWSGRGTQDEGYLMGLLIGDGHITTRGAAAFESYESDADGTEMREYVATTIKSLPGRADRLGWYYSASKKCWVLRDQEAGRLASSLGVVRGHKVVTPEIEQASSDFYRGFLAGVFDSDGHVNDTSHDRAIKLKWSDYESLKAVQRMLARLGIVSRMTVVSDKVRVTTIRGRETMIRPQWEIAIRGADRHRFAALIPLLHGKKRVAVTHGEQQRIQPTKVKVTSVTPDGVAAVYDIQVDDVHAFDGNGLMLHNCGVGVGFTTHTANLGKFHRPKTDEEYTFVVPDSREGWVESVRLLINSYQKRNKPTVKFDYSKIRPEGAPLRGFGGTSAGYAPLKKLHQRVTEFLSDYADGKTTQVRLIMDVMNSIGACVVAGNVRRSAQLAIGSPSDQEFINLKNYDLHPERSEIGWMSNNSIALNEREDFEYLPSIAERVRDNGEPGILNFINVRKYGRIGERMEDNAVAFNPCCEIALADRELCNLSEVFPTRCNSTEEIYEAMRLATFYSSTVALLRSHDASTNQILSQNRRIGVSVSGIADWIDATSVSHVFNVLNIGYEQVVRPYNKQLAKDAGVPESIRVTTIKPSGSISAVAGVSSGMHHPFDRYIIRRMRVAENSPITSLLQAANIPNEPDTYSDNTLVFEFPLRYGSGQTRSIKSVSIYEQAAIVAMLQKAWADNAVSNTLTVQAKELDQIERVLALFAPQTKSLSLLPDLEEGAYAQMPLEKITKDEFEKRSSKIKDIDWSALTGQDGVDQRFCTNDACEIP